MARSETPAGFLGTARSLAGVHGAAAETAVGRAPKANPRDRVLKEAQLTPGTTSTTDEARQAVAAPSDPLDRFPWGMDMIGARRRIGSTWATSEFASASSTPVSMPRIRTLQEARYVDANGDITPDGRAVSIKKSCTSQPAPGAAHCGFYQYLQGTSMAAPHAVG